MIKIILQFNVTICRDSGGKSKEPEKKEKCAGQSICHLAAKTIAMLTASKSKSTIDNYRTALNSFVSYAGKDITTEGFSKQLVEGWQRWLKEKGVVLNTISCYMRSLRALLSQSNTQGQAAVNDIFEGVFTGNTTTVKRSIPQKKLSRLKEVALPKGSSLCLARDIFLFSVYALGMPFVDVAFLQKKQIIDGYIEYHRHKTCQPIRVKVEAPMKRIIERYSQPDSLYVFPILAKGTMQEYENALNQYNRHLQKLSQLANLSRKITSYVARHSWASMAYHSNVDLPVISKALGHTSSKTTLVYLREIDDQRIDHANRQLLASIANPSR